MQKVLTIALPDKRFAVKIQIYNIICLHLQLQSSLFSGVKCNWSYIIGYKFNPEIQSGMDSGRSAHYFVYVLIESNL